VKAQAPTRRRTHLAFVCLAAFACVLLLPASAAVAKKSRPLYWGAVIGKELTGEAPPWDFSALEKFERKVHKKVSLLSFSTAFADCATSPCTPLPFPEQAMEKLREHGTIPFLSWASQSFPASLHQPDYSLTAIANGSLDPFIRDYAEQVITWNKPFFLRFDAEMNGFWFPWSEGLNGNTPGSFVAAWRHIHDIFEQVGANKVTWVWCPNVDFTRHLTPLKSLYPGNAYVDWTCLDGFNWGKTRNSAGWQSFDKVFRGTYKRVVKIAPSKPMVIGEVSSEERGGSKPNWIKSTLHDIPAHYPKVRGVIWFNEKDQGMDWPVESSKASLKAFRKAIGSRLYRPNLFANLPSARIQPPGP
jgi:hypothetical protein